MSGKSSLRRSRRSRIANQKYLNNDWDKPALELIRNSGSESDSEFNEQAAEVNDEEFVAIDYGGFPDGDHDDRDESVNVSSEDHSDIEDIQISESDAVVDKNRSTQAIPTRRVVTKATKKDEELQHSRGVPNIDRKGGKTTVFQDTFGADPFDVNAVLAALNRWHLRARDATMPSRATICEALAQGWLDRSLPGAGDDRMQCEIIPRRQQLLTATMDELHANHFIHNGVPHRVVLGPDQRQNMYIINHLESLDFGQAWEQSPQSSAEAHVEGENEAILPTDKGPNIETSHEKRSKRFHEGWLINVGEKVNSMAWCPESTPRRDLQYLAVACQSTKVQRDHSDAHDQSRSQAFTPSPGYPSSVQIWRIPSRTIKPDNIQTLSLDAKVEISYIIATQIGNIMQVEWVPTFNKHSDKQEYLGSLAILSTDGCLRLIDLPSPQTNASEPIVLKLKVSAICMMPPKGSVFSTFTFATPEDIVVGASNGEVRLYNLNQCRSADNVIPYFTAQLHHTYVMRVVTAGHSELSHFLASSSAAGDLRLTDLRSPHQDFINVPRSRLPTRNLIYCALTQSFITTVDHSGRTEVQSARTTISAHQLRHFYSQILLSKFPNNTGTASAMAGSRLHPYIIVGNTQGTVQCQNVFKKLLPRAGSWVQKLCEYEWMPAKTNEGANQLGTSSNNIDHTSSNDNQFPPSLYHGHDVRAGISRFREGFIIEKQDLSGASTKTLPTKSKKNKIKKRKASSNQDEDNNNNDADDDDGVVIDDDDDDDDDEHNNNNNNDEDQPDPKTKAKSKTAKTNKSSHHAPRDATIAEVIFEQENAVTAISWNENPACAGWIAVGWGSGIVRIQDLSHDTQ